MGYQLIETISVGSGGAASIEFTGIPQDGVDLVCLYSLRSETGGYDENLKVQFNSDTGSNYSRKKLAGNGATLSNNTNTGIGYIPAVSNGSTSTANTFSSFQMTISNYTSTANKSVSIDNVTENNATSAVQELTAGSYSTSSGITSIKVLHEGAGELGEYSTASLYKITAD